MELTLGAMPVQNEIRGQRAGKKGGGFRDECAYLAHQARGHYLQYGMGVAVYDLAGRHVATERFRQHKGIKRQQQFVVSAELIGPSEADRDQLCGLAPARRGRTLDDGDPSLEI